MYEVSVTTTIAASHHLRNYCGKCENVHGHNYKIEATVATSGLDKVGLAVDFGVLKAQLHEVTDRFDHVDLNACQEFESINPSSENLARVVFDDLVKRFEDSPVQVLRVKVWESDGSYVTYHQGSPGVG